MPAKKKVKRQAKAVTLQETAQPTQSTMVVTLYDGTRQPIQGGEFLIRIFDGFQNQRFDDFRPIPTTVFHLPFHDSLQDLRACRKTTGSAGSRTEWNSMGAPFYGPSDTNVVSGPALGPSERNARSVANCSSFYVHSECTVPLFQWKIVIELSEKIAPLTQGMAF